MSLIVQKYGGTSVGSIERITKVAERIKAYVERGDKVVVTVSAMSGETNRLLDLAKQITSTPNLRELDMLVSTGEQVSISLLALALQNMGVDAISFTGAQVGILTDDAHSKARIQSIGTQKILSHLEQNRVVIVAGFQGITEQGDITTLGRGGTDTTGVALAAALEAGECQIYTDVDGVYTTDPRICDKASKLDILTVEEMLEMASLGSKVLQIRSVEFASKYGVPIRVLSSFDEGLDNEGTLIVIDRQDGERGMEDPIISGIAFTKDEAKLTLRDAPDVPGIAARILSPISDANIEVDMIVQNVSVDGKSTDFSFTVAKGDFVKSLAILQQVAEDLNGGEVIGDSDIAKISLVGVGMRSHAGVASNMFKALGKEGINIKMVSTSEIKISVIIGAKFLELAVRTLHTAFGLDKKD